MRRNVEAAEEEPATSRASAPVLAAVVEHEKKKHREKKRHGKKKKHREIAKYPQGRLTPDGCKNFEAAGLFPLEDLTNDGPDAPVGSHNHETAANAMSNFPRATSEVSFVPPKKTMEEAPSLEWKSEVRREDSTFDEVSTRQAPASADHTKQRRRVHKKKSKKQREREERVYTIDQGLSKNHWQEQRQSSFKRSSLTLPTQHQH